MLADCWHKYHVTKYLFLRFNFQSIFLFDDDTWIFKLISDFYKSICGSTNFIQICNGFLDLISF